MQIGIISDIHADYAALKETLDRFDQHHQTDHILCAGDLVGRGPEPDRVIDLIRERKIPVARGNHDDLFSGELREENIAYLQNLPVDWRGELAGMALFMCHGKPGNNMWGMYKDHLSETYLRMVLQSLKADVLITGHTHKPLYIRIRQGCLANPGSLYTFDSTRASSHSYGVLSLSDLSFRVYDLNVRCGEPPLVIA